MPDRKNLRIACVIPTLRAGGAERVLTGLAADLAGRGHRVTLIALTGESEASFYEAAPPVHLIRLGVLRGEGGLGGPLAVLTAILGIRAALTSAPPDVVLGFTTLGNLLTVLATRGLTVPVVLAERVDPHGHRQRIGRARSIARDLLYARADHVVVQTDRARRGLAWVANSRISVIPNPIHPIAPAARPNVAGPDGRYRVVGVGRLQHQKGFDLLIEAFGAIAGRFPDWDLVVYGEGPDRAQLEALVARLNLGSRVRLAGLTRDIEGELARSHAMGFPSRFEGFPNALAEAMAAGLPTIAFPEVSGIEELIVDGDTGLLASWSDPVGSLTRGLQTLLSDPARRLAIGTSARAHVAAFAPHLHIERWDKLLSRATARNR